MAESAAPVSDELDLTHYLDVILRRRWIVAAATVIVFTTATLIAFTTKRVYRASAMLVIEKERGSLVQNGSLVENSNEDYYQTQYKLLESRTLHERVYSDLKLSETEDFRDPKGVEKLSRAVTISPVLRSRLLYVRADSHDPALAASIANRLSEAFVEQNLANQLFISKEVLEALQLSSGRASYESLPAVVNNPLIQTLKGEYAKLQSTHAELAQRYTEKHPALAQVKSNMNALSSQIAAETNRIVSSMKTELSGQLKGNNVRVIDPALIPRYPIKPKRLAACLFGLVAGLAIGVVLAFVVEIVDDSVRTQHDVENKLKTAFLGLVPQTRRHAQTVYESLLVKEPSLTSEALRNLRTMIDFAQVSQRTKAMIVTSTVQSEGKTFLSTNLGVVFAQLGESVLLVDGDLRRPKIHRNFSVSNERGLSTFLAAGKDVAELEDLVQESGVPGLKILSCGPRPPNPSELLNTPRLGAMLAWATGRFDRVLVDCAPMYPINDTILWGRHIPNCTFVVRFGRTRVPLIRTALQKLQNGGVKVLGVAINFARQDGLAYSSYGYYYSQYYEESADERGEDVAATKA